MSGVDNGVKAFPQYNVFAEHVMFSVRLMTPYFRYQRNSQALSVDANKKGRLLLEWIPRNSDGKQATTSLLAR